MQLDALGTIAEVGAAIAGFATLAAVFRRAVLDRQEMFGVVQCSLVAVGFAVLPLALPAPHHGIVPLAVALAILWTLVWGHAAIGVVRLMRDPDAPTSAAVATPIMTSNLAGTVFAVATVVSAPNRAVFYQLAVFCPLLTAMLLLWDVVRRYLQEPADG